MIEQSTSSTKTGELFAVEAVNNPLTQAALAAFPDAQITAIRQKDADGNVIMDFDPEPYGRFADMVQAHIDESMETHHQEQEPRSYIGASRIGDECERMLAYEFHRTPKDEGQEFQGKTLRVFDMGHDGEDRVASYLRQAGYTLVTHKPGGGQIGFTDAVDPATGKPRFAGHIDGVITSGPTDMGIGYPCLWENKALGDKGIKALRKRGVEKEKPVYFVQMQLYMAYLGLSDHPALFTALNRADGTLYAELVPFRADVAQAAIDKAVRVVQSARPEDLPRVRDDATYYRCKWCSYAARCYAQAKAAPQAAQAWGAWK